MPVLRRFPSRVHQNGFFANGALTVNDMSVRLQLMCVCGVQKTVQQETEQNFYIQPAGQTRLRAEKRSKLPL